MALNTPKETVRNVRMRIIARNRRCLVNGQVLVGKEYRADIYCRDREGYLVASDTREATSIKSLASIIKDEVEKHEELEYLSISMGG